jgi:hypothetical protein
VIGFFAASVLMTAVSARVPAGHVGRAPFAGTFRSGAEKIAYDADFSDYQVPAALAGKVSVDLAARELRFAGGGAPMTLHEYEALRDAIPAADPGRRDKIGALKQLRYRSDWFESVLGPRVIDPIKTLRSWAFVLCFLCIGLSTRIRDLLTFGLKPFWAFTIGVAVNVPLGYFLSTVVFSRFWSNIGDMM